MLSEESKILSSTEKSTTSKADPPDRCLRRTQARRPRVPCCISPHYGIIFTLKIPAVSSGTTWTLQLRNFLRTCITQGPQYFCHPTEAIMTKIRHKVVNETMPDSSVFSRILQDQNRLSYSGLLDVHSGRVDGWNCKRLLFFPHSSTQSFSYPEKSYQSILSLCA